MKTAADIELTIDEELHRGIPKHTPAEAKAFRESVDREGRYRDPIRYWQHNGTALVLDGRHRLEDWQSRPDDLPAPPVEEVMLPDKAAARIYIVREQLARRNLTEKAFKELLGELYNQQKKSHGGDRRSSGQSDHLKNEPENTGKTAEAIAAEHEVSPETVRRYGKLAESKNAINQTLPPLLIDIESYGVPDSAVHQIAKLNKPQMVEVRKNLKAGKKWNDGIGSQANGSKPKQYNDSFDTEEIEAAGASVVLDAIKREVPSHLTAQHAAAATLSSLGSRLDTIKREAVKLSEENGGEFLDDQEVTAAFKAAKNVLTQARYWSECPRCKGKPKPSCDRCDGHGFLPFARKGHLSDADKEWLGVS